MPDNETPFSTLDLRSEKCPLNFVKTRLALEKIPLNSFLEVWIDGNSESATHVPKSIKAEGHIIIKQEPLPNDSSAIVLWVRRLK